MRFFTPNKAGCSVQKIGQLESTKDQSFVYMFGFCQREQLKYFRMFLNVTIILINMSQLYDSNHIRLLVICLEY